MKLLRTGIFLSSLFVAQLAFADAESKKEAEKLFTTMQMKELISQSMTQMVDLELQQNPSLAPFKPVLLKFFAKHISWESLKPELLQVYSEAFSAQELREINAFYATTTGKKAVQLMPSLMAKGSQIGVNRVQQNIGELQSMILAESQRLEKLNTR
ncbi:MAG: DUF2059 domain-containing protein [Limnobacter sp.]|nr:DUF2059 domain-containing protein [Limnobacter sp.]